MTSSSLIPKQHCPYCKRNIGAATGIRSNVRREPRAGDLSVCYYCGEIAKFDHQLTLIKLSPEELVSVLRENPSITAVHRKILAMDRIR